VKEKANLQQQIDKEKSSKKQVSFASLLSINLFSNNMSQMDFFLSFFEK
jgi:hypothetical protein